MAGVAIITESCIGEQDRARVDVCPVHCIHEVDPVVNMLISEVEAGSGGSATSPRSSHLLPAELLADIEVAVADRTAYRLNPEGNP